MAILVNRSNRQRIIFCLVIRQKPPKYDISVSLDAELYIMIKDTDIKKDIHKIYGISLYKRVMSLYIKCNEKDIIRDSFLVCKEEHYEKIFKIFCSMLGNY